jgi:hypothetical protein
MSVLCEPEWNQAFTGDSFPITRSDKFSLLSLIAICIITSLKVITLIEKIPLLLVLVKSSTEGSAP